MSEEEQLVVEEVGSEAGVAPEVEAAPAEAEPAPSVADVEAEPAPIDDSPSVASGEGTPASFPSADDFSYRSMCVVGAKNLMRITCRSRRQR